MANNDEKSKQPPENLAPRKEEATLPGAAGSMEVWKTQQEKKNTPPAFFGETPPPNPSQSASQSDTAGLSIGRIEPKKVPASQARPPSAAPTIPLPPQPTAPVAAPAKAGGQPPPMPPPIRMLSGLIELERAARHAQSLETLFFFIVNRTREIFFYDRAVLLTQNRLGNLRLAAVSNIAVVKRDTPYAFWLESACNHIKTNDPEKSHKPHVIERMELPRHLSADWQKYNKDTFLLWCPLIQPGTQNFLGVLVLSRAEPWLERDVMLIARLCDAYGHAWGYLLGGAKPPRVLHKMTRKVLILLGSLLGLSLFLPVQMSVLASMEIRPKNPTIVTAPLSGTIKDILWPANEFVKKGNTLFIFEDTVIKNDLNIAEKSLAVARQRYQTALQRSFNDDRQNQSISVLELELQKAYSEYLYKQALFEFSVVKAPEDGLLIYGDKNDWIGRPVEIGQRIMSIVDPQKVEVQVDLPVEDALVIEKGAQVKIFLNTSPLNSLDARLIHAAYESEPDDKGHFHYRLIAELEEGESVPRIGSKGTAKVYGDHMLLFMYLFRRPLSTLRQRIGF